MLVTASAEVPWQELENKITQIEKHEAERREQEERKHKEEASFWT